MKKISTTSLNRFNQNLCHFLDSSPTPFHAASNIVNELVENGFELLDETETWALKSGQGYCVVRNGSSVIAWRQGKTSVSKHGWRILGAHTDSPCLKVKPTPDIHHKNSWQLGVEVYGGALLNPWFDRDLSLAGRVHFTVNRSKGKSQNKNTSKEVVSTLINLKCPIATIPSLAIHLDREANKNRSINPQLHLPVILAANDDVSSEASRKKHYQLEAIINQQLAKQGYKVDKILDHELFFYDTQPSGIVGVNGDFLASARLDNLLSCYIDMQALIQAGKQAEWAFLVCSDHEEVGSQSAAGAAGPFLQQVMQRIESDSEQFVQAVAHSILISTDNAHALHPNYRDKMEPNHAPLINAGPVVKINANQRYASNSETQALFRSLCIEEDIPVQNFVVRTDMGCGSTIGPITAAELGIKTLDVGVPTWAMHSIREQAGSRDAYYMFSVLKRFLQRK